MSFTDAELAKILQTPEHLQYSTARDEIIKKCYKFIQEAKAKKSTQQIAEAYELELLDALMLFMESPTSRLSKYDSLQGDIVSYILNVRNSVTRTYASLAKEATKKAYVMLNPSITEIDFEEKINLKDQTKLQKKLIQKWQTLKVPSLLLRPGSFVIDDNQKAKQGTLKYQRSYLLGSAYRHLSVDWDQPSHAALAKFASQENPTEWGKIPEYIESNWLKKEEKLAKYHTSIEFAKKNFSSHQIKKQKKEANFLKKFAQLYSPNSEPTTEQKDMHDEITKIYEKMQLYQTQSSNKNSERQKIIEDFYTYPIDPEQLTKLFQIKQQDVYQYIQRYKNHFPTIFIYEDQHEQN